MQDINWVTITVNAAISLLLSFIMFALGMRSGKERTERLRLRDKYRELYAHINSLYEGLTSYKPLNWNHFSKPRSLQSTPPCKEMMENGEYLELSNSIFPKIVELERKSLWFGWRFKELSISAGGLITEYLRESNIALKEDKYSVETHYENVGSVGQSFVEINPVSLLSETLMDEYVDRFKNSGVGIKLSYINNSQIKYSIHLRNADKQHFNIEEILTGVKKIIKKEGQEFLSEREDILKELERTRKKLGKLVKEPHSFWGTLFKTIRDLFS